MALRGIHFLELTELARRLRAKALSPVEVTEAMLRRIERRDGKLRSYALATAELALKQAKKAEAELMRGRVRGPLHGVPVALKDLCYTRGVVTAAGTKVHAKFKPRFDATVTQRLAEAGAVLLGKLKMTEGAFSEHHPEVAPPLNPWHAAHWTGVSSSGSGVATAAGLCFASLGSDTGGSIRFPSAANGVTGLKPTWGRVSRHGVFDLAPSLDHVGPMCRSAADCAAVLGVIAGADGEDPTAVPLPVPNYLAGLERPVRGLRIGVDPAYNSNGVDDAMRRTAKDAEAVLRELGAEIRRVRFPDPDQVTREWVSHCAVECATAHAATYPKRKDDYGPALGALIEHGRSLTAMDYQRLLQTRRAFSGRVAALFEDIDLLLIPAMWHASPSNDEIAALRRDPDGRQSLLRFSAPFDYSGSPALTLPSGFTEAGMPIAVQLVGRHFEEDVVLRAGHAFQRATDWHRRHPKL
jgi:amidase